MCLPERGPVDGGGDPAGRIASFQGVFYRYGGDGRTIFQGGKIASVDDLSTDQRPGAIVDQNDVRVVGNCRKCLEPGLDRVLAPAPSGHDYQMRRIDGIPVKQGAGLCNPVGGDNNDNVLDVAVVKKSPHGTDENRYPGQQVILLRIVDLHPGPEAGGGNYGSS